MIRIVLLILNIFFISPYSFSIELFGYKLYEDINRYQNDGDINYKKNIIDNIVIYEDRVLISNKYLNQYTIKSTKNGSIFEIHGSNRKLDMSPVECLDVQNKFITSFEKKKTWNFFLPMYNNSQISFKAKLPGRFIYKKKKMIIN